MQANKRHLPASICLLLIVGPQTLFRVQGSTIGPRGQWRTHAAILMLKQPQVHRRLPRFQHSSMFTQLMFQKTFAGQITRLRPPPGSGTPTLRTSYLLSFVSTPSCLALLEHLDPRSSQEANVKARQLNCVNRTSNSIKFANCHPSGRLTDAARLL